MGDFLDTLGVVDERVGPNGELVAIKREVASDQVTRLSLEHEYHVYKILAGHDCILDVKAYGRQYKHNVMVMAILGSSLDDRLRRVQRFSLKTTARQTLGMVRHVIAHDCILTETITCRSTPLNIFTLEGAFTTISNQNFFARTRNCIACCISC